MTAEANSDGRIGLCLWKTLALSLGQRIKAGLGEVSRPFAIRARLQRAESCRNSLQLSLASSYAERPFFFSAQLLVQGCSQSTRALGARETNLL